MIHFISRWLYKNQQLQFPPLYIFKVAGGLCNQFFILECLQLFPIYLSFASESNLNHETKIFIQTPRYFDIIYKQIMRHSPEKQKKNSFTSKICSKAVTKAQLSQKGPDIESLTKKLQEESHRSTVEAGKMNRSIEAFFIGPRGQNIEFFSQLIKKAIDTHLAARLQYQLEDARHITRRMKSEPAFLDAQDRLERALNMVLTKMKDLTPPFFSSRYFGHMIWETTIPGIVGNFATLLYNPNNCAYEAAPFTTLLQIQVMKQFSKLYNYPPFLSFSENTQPAQSSWGHLTCGGTVANCEALWAARNVRFLTLTLRKYIQHTFPQNTNGVRDVLVHLANGTQKKVLELTAWQLFNIPNDETMKLYDRIFQTIYPSKDEQQKNYSKYQNGVAQLSVGKKGLMDMFDWLRQINKKQTVHDWPVDGSVPRPKLFISATAHYSLRKSFSILGLGENAGEKVIVDLDSRISIPALTKKLDHCLHSKTPVLVVVGIVGTTEESTVDNLQEILRLQKQFSAKGLYFHFHIDGAYGGYFVATIRQKAAKQLVSFSPYVVKQLQTFQYSDSITFDPHKTGYVPYACGGIIYRNHRLRDNLSFSAPYIYTGAEPNMAIYGIQGSKPGSSVTSVYLSLQVLPLVRNGHGELLERTMMNTKIFTASLYRIKDIDVQYSYEKTVEGNTQMALLKQKFDCLLLPRLYCEKFHKPELRSEQLAAICKISETSPQNLWQTLQDEPDDKFDRYYYELGPDMNIVCYGLNFRDPVTHEWNRSLKKYNLFNKTLIKLSKPVGSDVSVRMKDLYVSETEISKHTYGEQVFNDFLHRHNLQADGDEQIVIIRSTIMNAFFTELSNLSQLESSNRTFVRQLVENGCQTLLYLNWR